MKGVLLHIAADTTNPGVVGPVFGNMNFEFLPISNTFGVETRTYYDFPARNTEYGRTLADFLPSDVAKLCVHPDPDFIRFTYAEPVIGSPKNRALLRLEKGDILFFFASLAPYDSDVYKSRDTLLKNCQTGKKNKYVIGFFTVQGVAQVFVLKSDPRLALTLFNLLEAEPPLDLKDLTSEIEILKEHGYITQKDDVYELTKDGIRTVEGIADALSQQESDSSKQELLEKGQLDIELVSGNVTEDLVKSSHHYKRLWSLDWDSFILVSGDPNRSDLLMHAVQLTDHFERYEFILNSLGQSILRRATDVMRGARPIDEDAVSLLASEIVNSNPEFREKVVS